MCKNRILAALLASLMLTPALASCSDSAADTAETTADTTAAETTEAPEPELSDDLPEMDFGGYTFTFLTSSTTTQHIISAVNEDSGDVLDSALYNRTRAVAEKYNISFNDDIVESSADKALTAFRNSVTSGDQAYDVTNLLERRAFAMVTEGYFADISALKYTNMDKPYWSGDINELINLTEKIYLAYGSMVLGMYDMTHIILFNKQMQENLKLENPDDMVWDGTWTLDKMTEMGKAARKDANGDGAWGTEDTYAIVGGSNAMMYAFLSAARLRTAEVVEEGVIRINLLSNPKIEEVFTKISDICWDPGFWYTKSTNSNNYHLTDTYFQTNQSLFADHTFSSMIQLRDMEADFGVVPFPKYTDDQEEYGAMVEAGTRAITVPATVKNPDLVGAVLETMNFLSYRDIIPVYYEVVMKQKVSRDSESAKMLDLILDSICYDLGATMFNDQIKDGIFRNLFRDNKREYASQVTTQIPKIEQAITAAGGKSLQQ